MGSYMTIIHPDVCIHINSIKRDSNTFPFLIFTYIEMLSIPACSTYSKASRYFGDSIGSERRICSGNVFNAPVMRKIHLTPLFIIQI